MGSASDLNGAERAFAELVGEMAVLAEALATHGA